MFEKRIIVASIYSWTLTIVDSSYCDIMAAAKFGKLSLPVEERCTTRHESGLNVRRSKLNCAGNLACDDDPEDASGRRLAEGGTGYGRYQNVPDPVIARTAHSAHAHHFSAAGREISNRRLRNIALDHRSIIKELIVIKLKVKLVNRSMLSTPSSPRANVCTGNRKP